MESKLGPDGNLVTDPTLYRSLAGGLQYLTFTRPNISYAVQQVCLYMHDLREPHLAALKRILRYVRGTLGFGLQLYASSTISLIAYSDADLAGCPATRRSTSGYCVFLGNNLLSWSSKRQHMLSRSSAEAEYRDVANVVTETAWLRNLLLELHTLLLTATLVYCDNVSAIYMSVNPVQHQRTKHIKIDIHFVRDMVSKGQVRVLHVPSRYQYADIFTKGLPFFLFEEFRSSLCAWTLKRGLKRVRLVAKKRAERVGLGADVGAEMASEISIKDNNGNGDVYKEDDQIPSKGKRLFITRVMQMANERWEVKIHSDIRRLEQQLENLLSLTLMRKPSRNEEKWWLPGDSNENIQGQAFHVFMAKKAQWWFNYVPQTNEDAVERGIVTFFSPKLPKGKLSLSN
ncbi:ribonuclease H-like domain-containing protein [Tanacetum coccineum]